MTFIDELKADWKKGVIGLIVVATFTFGGDILAVFKTGTDVELERKLIPIIEKVFIEKMSDDSTMASVLSNSTITNFVREVRVESQKQIIKLTKNDSIKLRGLLRMEMDLRESQDVAKEIGWTYFQVKGMKKYIDSVVTVEVKRANRVARF